MWVTECEKDPVCRSVRSWETKRRGRGGIGIVLGALLREESDNEEMDQAVYLVFVAAKEKAKKLGARLVLSCYYQDDVKTKEYIKSNYYLYISKSKNGSQYLDSLYGEASVSDSGDYSSNIFLLENKEQEVAA